MSGEPRRSAAGGSGGSPGAGLFLLVAFVSLYLLWPSVGEVFDQWRSLTQLKPDWVAVALGVEALSFVAVWELQRIALQTKRWFPVAMSQLAGNAFGRIIPGGVAAAGALQYRMLVRAGLPGARIASSLTAVSALLFGAVLALPLLSLPAILGGTPVASGLAQRGVPGRRGLRAHAGGRRRGVRLGPPARGRREGVERVAQRDAPAEARRDRARRSPARGARHRPHGLRPPLAGGRPRGGRQVDLRLPRARRLPARGRRRAEPVAGPPRLRRRRAPRR